MIALRPLAVGAVFAAIALTGCSQPAPDGRTAFERETDRAKGSPDAAVTMIEYASVACGGCAQVHEMAMPTVESFVESGDVRYVLREMITGQRNIAVAGFMLASCAPEDQYFDVINVLFDQQRALFTAMQQGRAQAQFQTIARTAGFSDEEFSACMTDTARLEAVQAANEQANADGITATPTFIFNGQLLETGSHPDVQGPVFAVAGQALVDAQGPIPGNYEGATIERVILYFKALAQGASPSAESDAGSDTGDGSTQ